ncbi:MAG: creatininase family protein [Bryobacteraceae bacterium]|jgi:creatinine amidohydrolase
MRLVLGLLFASLLCAQTSRELSDLNWMEFRDLVPAKVSTVLLPTGTMEAHGVINNGADSVEPLAIARQMAPRVNALVAPVVPYGVTGSLDAYAGGFTIGESAYRAYMADVLAGLARNGFRNIIIVNGHGGPQTAILNDLAETAGRAFRVRTLVVNWWTYCSDVTLKVFGEDGGHAGWNETAFIQAIDPKLVHPELYKDSLATPRPATGSWSAYPFPSPIILYQPGQGYVKFDQAKADAYFKAVVDKMTALVQDTIAKWDQAGIFK